MNIARAVRAILVSIVLIIPVFSSTSFATPNNLAQTFNAEGLWEALELDARFDVSYCGDGTQICVKLVWIKPSVINQKNRTLLDTYVIYEGRSTSPLIWRGKLNVYEYTFDGKISVLEENKVAVQGCAFFIFCKSFTMDRIG